MAASSNRYVSNTADFDKHGVTGWSGDQPEGSGRLVSTSGRSSPDPPGGADPLTIGKRVRHRRRSKKLTLEEVATQAGISTSALSMIETGRREARLSTLQAIAVPLEASLDHLLSAEPPSRRASLEIELERMQRSPRFTNLGVSPVRPGPQFPIDALESLVALHHRLGEVEAERDATPEHARQANLDLRARMRSSNNYFPEIESLAADLLDRIDHDGGPLTRFDVGQIAGALGFTLIGVDDLPRSTRSVTDLANRRIYLRGADQQAQRTNALAAIGHIVLEHRPPASYAEFLAQRVEVNYFAAATLVPQAPAVEALQQAKQRKDIAIDDLRDRYAVSYEMAAHRFTNLATRHLDIPVHFMRVNRAGVIYKCYANDGVQFPTDASGAVEGQTACRHWTCRQVFERPDWSVPYQQYTDMASGTFWCTAVAEQGPREAYSVSVGVPFEHVKWFRGRDTPHRSRSRCPDPDCCRTPPPEQAKRWSGNNWPSARVQSHLLASLPAGAFPGVDESEVLDFLDRHAPAHV